jgi:D-serine dehydratase
MLNLSSIHSSVLDAQLKGYPYDAAPCELKEIASRRWNVLRGDLPFPIAVLKRSALANNLDWMADFTAASGVQLAPHGKTTMAPQLFDQQLRAGAWGMTLANMQQVNLAVGWGLRRIIVANQLIAAIDIRHAGHLKDSHADLELFFLVDSISQLRQIEKVARESGINRPFTVLVELGLAGGRTGCRSVAEALALAHAIAGSQHAVLAGVECYEGLHISGDSAKDKAAVEDLMASLRDLAMQCDAETLFALPRIIVSAGGSAVFDLVAEGLHARLSKPVLPILRSGCYVTHDSGFYERVARRIFERLDHAQRRGKPGGLRPALEVWAQVQSQPEPGLAILTLGKRDASFDMDLPRPQAWVSKGAPLPVGADWRIDKMNDQHAYLRFAPGTTGPQVGDLIGCGISHPCTTFDRWRWMPVVDDEYGVVDAIRTFF